MAEQIPPPRVPQERMAVIPLNRIMASPYQPRRDFNAEALRQLAESIVQHGLIQPLTVRPLPLGYYELIAGERRWRACHIAGVRLVRACVVHVDDFEAALLTVSENLQREDLNCFEEAEGYRVLLELKALTQQQLARQLGLAQSTIANKLRLLRLDSAVRDYILENALSERHSRALLKLHDKTEQMRVAKEIVKKRLSVRRTELLVERRLQEYEREPEQAKTIAHIARSWRDWRLFANTMKSAVGELKQAGLPAHFEIVENSDEVHMSIIVPKTMLSTKNLPSAAQGAAQKPTQG